MISRPHTAKSTPRWFAGLTFFLALVVLLPVRTLAKPLVFTDHHFSVEIPPGWAAITPQPPETMLAVQNPGKTEKFLVFATKVSLQEHPDAERQSRENVKQSLTKGGYQVDAEQQKSIGGFPLTSFAAHASGGSSVTVYMGSAGDEIYMLQAVSLAGGDANDPQLESAVQSFRLLSSAPVAGAAEPPPSPVRKPESPIHRSLRYSLLAIGLFGLIRLFVLRKRKR